MRKKNWRRGQEEAPIELLVAITLLTFVLILGLYTYQNMCRTQFEQKMKSSIHTFVSMLESVYHGASGSAQPVLLDFTPEGCGSFDEVRIFTGSPDSCRKQVGMDECLVIGAVIASPLKSKRETLIVEAMSIPSTVTVEYSGWSNWESISDFLGHPNLDPNQKAFKGMNNVVIKKTVETGKVTITIGVP